MASKSLVVIVGPTASGKTSLSIEVAKRFKGEIICADSRSIYSGMDIGTAKPTKKEQSGVPHWGLDLVEPGQYFSVADFKEYTDLKIAEIQSRNRLPILVGGTGLYVDSVLFNYQFGAPANAALRSKLQRMELHELHEYCAKNNITLPENSNNKRYVIRAIENSDEDVNKSTKPAYDAIVVGIATEKDQLMSRISMRCEQLFDDGVVEEAKKLCDVYGWDNEAMKSNIYPLIHRYLLGDMTLNEVKEKFITLDWKLAKRQMTWMRRNKYIKWLPLSDAVNYIVEQLAIRS
ncbi:tRNA (adenosine(37)-N6)-dimethylallyltransferase MiaA [Candidatus Saccharibacteria bacterium]|nr:tRNA (adenosine(37)-N6)-dimethylallyltransferase MiaA [Candidatus Saccharibacteria bacterium]